MQVGKNSGRFSVLGMSLTPFGNRMTARPLRTGSHGIHRGYTQRRCFVPIP